MYFLSKGCQSKLDQPSHIDCILFIHLDISPLSNMMHWVYPSISAWKPWLAPTTIQTQISSLTDDRHPAIDMWKIFGYLTPYQNLENNPAFAYFDSKDDPTK